MINVLIPLLFLIFTFSVEASSCGFVNESQANQNLSNVFKICVVNKNIENLSTNAIKKCSGSGFEPGSATLFLGKDLLATALHLFVGRDDLKSGFDLETFLIEPNEHYSVFIMDSHDSPIIAEAIIIDAFQIDGWMDGVVALKLKEGSNLVTVPFATWNIVGERAKSKSLSWKGFHIDDNLIMEVGGQNLLNRVKVKGGFTAKFDRFQGLSGGAIVDAYNNGVVYGIGLGSFDSDTLKATTYLDADILVNQKYKKLVKMSYILDEFSNSRHRPVYKSTTPVVEQIAQSPEQVLPRLTRMFEPGYAYLAMQRCEEFINNTDETSLLLNAMFSVREKTCSTTSGVKCIQKANIRKANHDEALVAYVNTKRFNASQVINNKNSDEEQIRLAIGNINSLQIHSKYLEENHLVDESFADSSTYDIALAFTKLQEYDMAQLAANRIAEHKVNDTILFNKNQLLGYIKNQINAPNEAANYYSTNVVNYLKTQDKLTPKFYRTIQDLGYSAYKSDNLMLEQISIKSDEIPLYDFENSQLKNIKKSDKVPVSLVLNGKVLEITPTVWQQVLSEHSKDTEQSQLIINTIRLSNLKLKADDNQR